ncbi:MAG: pyridoxal-dependent decarboxylase [Brevundimonas sp.]|nr:pyridoxal-dependent decarboxylase [Brevundimonas sp.]
MTADPARELVRAYFPGARSENGGRLRSEMDAILDHWFRWRSGRFEDSAPAGGPVAADAPARHGDRLGSRLLELCDALTAETPTFSPRYIAHMKADLSLPGLLGWFAAMLHNPNNSSRDASRVGSVIETEAIGALADMLGYDPLRAQGHFTSGGTVANFEAVWRARYRLDHWLALALHIAETTGETLDPFAAAHMGWERFRALRTAHAVSDDVLKSCSAAASNPGDVWRRISRSSGRDYRGPVMLAPGNRHYSWSKSANIFGLGAEAMWSVALDARGRLDLADFERLVDRAQAEGRPILMAVAVAGATETGAVDPLDRLYDRMDQWRAERGWRIWRHVDAAYGGFLRGMLDGPSEAALAPETADALRAMGRSDSITIDPHKLGYVPYACGAFLTPDAEHYAVSAFDAPYLDRPELGDGKWSSTLEGSRSAAGAAATWLTAQTLGFGAEGLGALMAATVRARQAFEAAVRDAVPEARFLPVDSNIACFSLARPGEGLSLSNARTGAVFDHFQRSPHFAVSKTTLGADNAALIAGVLAGHDGRPDADAGMLVIRCVFMNPYWSESPVTQDLLPGFVDELRGALIAAEPARAA